MRAAIGIGRWVLVTAVLGMALGASRQGGGRSDAAGEAPAAGEALPDEFTRAAPGEIFGSWHLDRTATRAIWPGTLPQEWSVGLVEQAGMPVLAGLGGGAVLVEAWRRRGVESALFELPARLGVAPLRVECTVVGRGPAAAAVVTLEERGTELVHYLCRRRSAGGGGARPVSGGFWTRLARIEKQRLTLENGIRVDVREPLDFLAPRARAFLHSGGQRIWLEGQGHRQAEFVRGPGDAEEVPYQTRRVRHVADDGTAFLFMDGSVFEPGFATTVGAFSRFQTTYVVAGSILLFESGEHLEQP
ncbi:MAG: hypothetical protein CMJ84_09390 [Planctomycetes bacterium]|jgi:hypothetical protein|nr:hypothetical protein [Planctomycetota bacterium]MDP6408370.1 hypothetical protein [Planctomycetota bacterium]